MRIKKADYRYDNIYALYYKSNNTLYLNKNFVGNCKIIILNCLPAKASVRKKNKVNVRIVV